MKRTASLILLSIFAVSAVSSSLFAQGIRDHTRPTYTSGTTVSESQAVELTLTLTEVSMRPVQTWVRTAGAMDRTGKILTAYLHPSEAALIKVGQRARAFSPDSISSMYQAWVTRVAPQESRVRVEVSLSAQGQANRTYVIEIVVERGHLLSVPNEAVIEEGDKLIVYVQQDPGHYMPQEIHMGVQGELYAQVLHGLSEGQQVVTFGNFFIDSEYKLKASPQSAMSNDHQQHH